MIGFMQFQMAFAMTYKNKIERHTSGFQYTNCTGSGFRGISCTWPSFYRIQTWLVWRVHPPRVSAYIREIPAGNYNRNNRGKSKICSKLTIKTPERRQCRRSDVFIVKFEHIGHLVLVFMIHKKHYHRT